VGSCKTQSDAPTGTSVNSATSPCSLTKVATTRRTPRGWQVELQAHLDGLSYRVCHTAHILRPADHLRIRETNRSRMSSVLTGWAMTMLVAV
jgi:hypothetical protein